jgi:hypothetical protein
MTPRFFRRTSLKTYQSMKLQVLLIAAVAMAAEAFAPAGALYLFF